MNIDDFTRKYLLHAASLLADHVAKVWPSGADMVMAPLPRPVGVHSSQVATDAGSGICIRCVMDRDLLTGTWMIRTDVLFGFANVARPHVVSPAEAEAIALLLEAKAEWTAQLETFKRAA